MALGSEASHSQDGEADSEAGLSNGANGTVVIVTFKERAKVKAHDLADCSVHENSVNFVASLKLLVCNAEVVIVNWESLRGLPLNIEVSGLRLIDDKSVETCELIGKHTCCIYLTANNWGIDIVAYCNTENYDRPIASVLILISTASVEIFFTN